MGWFKNRSNKVDEMRMKQLYKKKLNVIRVNISELLKLWGLTLYDIIDGHFNDPQLVYNLFYGQGTDDFKYFLREYMQALSEEEKKQFMRSKDWRDVYDYFRNMVLGWILEEAFVKWLRKKGIPVTSYDGVNGSKILFERNHYAKLDLNLAGVCFLEVQHTLQPLKRGKIELHLKYWKVKKLSSPDTYLVLFFLQDKKVAVIHVFDYLRRIKRVEDYYAKGKDAFLLEIKYKNPINFPHYCICDVNRVDKYLLELLKLHALKRKKRKHGKTKIGTF